MVYKHAVKSLTKNPILLPFHKLVNRHEKDIIHVFYFCYEMRSYYNHQCYEYINESCIYSFIALKIVVDGSTNSS